MGFCNSCGTEYQPGVKFCGSCGTPTEDGDTPTTPNPAVVEDPGRDAARKRLVQFYQLHNPEKLHDTTALDGTLDAYRGQWDQMFSDLERKYASSNGGNSGKKKGKKGGKSLAANEADIPKMPDMVEGLQILYKRKIKPLEEAYHFQNFHSPCLTDTDFKAAPFVLLIGQYSTGKTSFIRYLLERDFPGCRIGPEPTTDRFVAVMHGPEQKVIPGNAAAVQADKPFTALQKHGMAFLNRFEVSECPAPILESMTFIDTPGVLSGEKQRIARGYNFPKVIEWFAQRSDRILLLFDAHKLDISDEFKTAIMSLKGQDDKVRCVLNKSDTIDSQQLMRVYGALMWSLGKVFNTPEVCRVYVGSFWDQPYKEGSNKELFDMESLDLLADLRSIPRQAALRKINELVKRARMAKVHALVIAHLRDQFGWFGKANKQKKLLDDLPNVFRDVQRIHNLPVGDFPSVRRFKEMIQEFDISKMPKLKKTDLPQVEEALSIDIPRLMRQLPGQSDQADADAFQSGTRLNPGQQKEANPFASGSDQIGNASYSGTGKETWAISGPMKSAADAVFHALPLVNKKASGGVVRPVMVKSALPQAQLRAIWELSDIDKDGHLDHEEFAVCYFLLREASNGKATPEKIPLAIVPPSKRSLVMYGS